MFRIIGDDIGNLLFGIGFGIVQGGTYSGWRVLPENYNTSQDPELCYYRCGCRGGLLAVLVVGGSMVTWARSKLISYHTLRRFKWFVLFNHSLVWIYDEAIWDRCFAVVIIYLMKWMPTVERGENDSKRLFTLKAQLPMRFTHQDSGAKYCR
jgi:hypothetical protein